MPSEVVYFVASSLDGYIADSSGSLDWLLSLGNDASDVTSEFIGTVGVQVMGSATYEWLLQHEGLLEQPHRWQEFFGDLPTVVFSSRSLPVPSGADVVIVDGSVESSMTAIRERARERRIWVVGGGALAAQFAAAGLLDQIEITYAPVILGAGTPLFGTESCVLRLSLRELTRSGPFVHAVYDVLRDN